MGTIPANQPRGSAVQFIPSRSQAAAEPVLRCPVSSQRLYRCSLPEAEASAAGEFRNRRGERPAASGATMLVREDGARAYSLQQGVPVLLGPEASAPAGSPQITAPSLPQYAEAYSEMEPYNQVAAERASREARSDQARQLSAARNLSREERARFPLPGTVWCDSLYEYAAQRSAYALLAPLQGKRLLQMGGTGIHAIKFLLAGAAEAWLITPMQGEAVFSTRLAQDLGLQDRFHAVVGIGEELPFAPGAFHGIYAGSCLHHMVTSMAAREARRVLAPGGVFAAIDPWRAPLQRIGTALLGKRERDVFCRPIDPVRFQDFCDGFPGAWQQRFGALVRYPLLGLQKFGLNLEDSRVCRLMDMDERLCCRWPALRALGSCILIAARA